MQGDFVRLLQQGQQRVEQTKAAISPAKKAEIVSAQADASPSDEVTDATALAGVAAALPEDTTGILAVRKDIHDALAGISDSLARGYIQVKKDLADANRVSWAGSAHEIREVLATMLRLLAPDKLVEAQKWYKLEPDAKGPTQKQRVRYIVQQHNAGSKEREVVEQVGILDERIDNIGNLVRAICLVLAMQHIGQRASEVRRHCWLFRSFRARLTES
ncbi:MAG: hypothetical protein U0841_04460 [Chloroflexia bacterium]